MSEHPSLVKAKPSVEEVEAVAKEFLEPFQLITQQRRRIRETEQEIRGLITSVMTKLDGLAEMKKENMQLEREVLEKLKAELNR
jgi:fructose/tagatose bisphosphate aldolase